MKRIALATAAIAALSAPAFAQSQLEASVGATGLTTSQLVQLKFAQSETGNDAVVYFDGETFRFSTSGAHNERAQAIFQQLASEDDETN